MGVLGGSLLDLAQNMSSVHIARGRKLLELTALK